MKKVSFVLIILSVIVLSCGKKHNIVIEGSFNNGGKKMLYLDRLDINKTIAVDSQKIAGSNNFRFKLYSDYPDLYVLRNKNGKIINLLPSPGERIKVQGNYENFDSGYSVSGSTESGYVRQLVEKLNDTRARLKKLDQDFKKPRSGQDQTSTYLGSQKEIIKDQRDFSIRFIVEHLKSISSIYALYQKLSPDQLVLGDNKDIQYMKIVADSLSAKYPDVPFVKAFVNDARSAERRYYNLLALQKKMNEVKTTLPDIELPDVSGKNLKLSSLRGKTVLLYFWSPLSDSCLKENRQILQIYNSYKNRGFEVYAVAVTNDETAWANTVVLDRLNWKNVIEKDPGSQVLWAYNLSGIPTDFLINKEGEILSRNLFGTDLKIWLDNTLK